MESKCFYCPASNISLERVVSYVVVGGKTYPVCVGCDEIVGAITYDEFETYDG
jgi:hypothetical protein